MKKIYFVRHGESEANAAGLMAGSYDTHLTKQGREQAQKTGEDLKGKGIELIVCTPLSRTHQTAEEIAKQIGYDPDKIMERKEFTERMYGPYEGTSFVEYSKKSEGGVTLEGVETLEELRQRIEAGLEWLKKQNAETILVASHGATGRMIKLIAQKLPHSHYHLVERIGNAEVYEFDLED